MEGVMKVNPKSSITRKEFFSFFLFFVLHLYEKMGVRYTYCGNHSTIYVNQTITLYTLSLYSDMSIISQYNWEKKDLWRWHEWFSVQNDTSVSVAWQYKASLKHWTMEARPELKRNDSFFFFFFFCHPVPHWFGKGSDFMTAHKTIES